MVSPEIMTKPRTSGEKPAENLRQADNSHKHSTQGKCNNKQFFLTGDYRYPWNNRDRQDSMKNKNQLYPPYHFAPSPALSAGSDLLSHSIMQLAETQSRSLEIFEAQQKSQNRCSPGNLLGPTKRRSTTHCFTFDSSPLMEIVPSVSNG